MAKNPFVVLGLDSNCTQNELFDRYKDLRNKYASQRFEEGERGSEACKMLDEIEDAYNQANDILASRIDVKYSGDDLSSAENALRDGRLDDAQKILDDCQNRTAQWHYIQSAIFYKKNFFADAQKQLEFACAKDPSNIKYAEAKQAIDDKIKANSASQGSFYNNATNPNNEDGGRSYREMPHRGAGGTSMCDCCSSLICADCCCECMGGDLISCC